MATKTTSSLLFSLGSERFGVSVENVLRVISLEKIMRVPKAPEFIAGAMNLEGNVIPIVDLSRKIELGTTEAKENGKVVVLEIEHEEGTIQVGVLIDEVLDVIEVEAAKMLPPALENMGFNTSTLDGMYKVDEEFYMILNARKVFEKELASLVS